MIHLVHVTAVPETLGFFRGQVKYLKEHGFTVSVISSPGSLLNEFAALEDVPATAIPISRPIAPLADLVSLIRLSRALRKMRPDIVHAHTPKAGLLGMIAARLNGCRAVLSVFGLPQMTRTGATRVLLNLLTRLACRLANAVWCDSFSMRDYLANNGLCDQSKVFVLGKGSVNGVDALGRFNPGRFGAEARRRIRAEWMIPDDAYVIGFVGRIARDKGFHELTRAWLRLREVIERAYLLLVGETEHTDPISPEEEQMLRNDNRVRFTEWQSDVTPFFAAMDVFVMPSYREGFTNGIIEASAFALPVVATRIPGCVDSVVDGVTGTLVPVRNAGALADAIEAYYRDAGLRHRHGRAGRERVLVDFQPEAIWSGLVQRYTRLVSKSSEESPNRD